MRPAPHQCEPPRTSPGQPAAGPVGSPRARKGPRPPSTATGDRPCQPGASWPPCRHPRPPPAAPLPLPGSGFRVPLLAWSDHTGAARIGQTRAGGSTRHAPGCRSAQGRRWRFIVLKTASIRHPAHGPSPSPAPVGGSATDTTAGVAQGGEPPRTAEKRGV